MSEWENFGTHARNGYYILRYPFTEKLLTSWYPVDLKNVLTTTEFQKTNDSGPSLSCLIEFLKRGEKRNYLGKYQPNTEFGVYTIHIILPFIENIQDRDNGLDSVIDKLPGTVTHELGHFAQELLQVAKTNVPHREKNLRKFGYPSKSIQQGGEELTPDKSAWVNQHELRDIEFYTRLADAKTELTANLDSFDRKWNAQNFKAFIGVNQDSDFAHYSNHWLKTLKTQAPGKYKKAVAELYKAVRDQYLPIS
jgi:hypothetical protein